MATIHKSDILRRYNASQKILLEETSERRWAANSLQKEFESFSFSEHYDIFLSHAYSDARIVMQIRNMLIENGYSVYVDWIEDEHLDRGKVSEYTAIVLRNRMNNCSSLIYLTSDSAENSVWMPWELGYMDARTGSVSVAPIIENDGEEFEGREYLGLYPYLDLTADSFYIHKGANSWVTFKDWMQGKRPK
ncbi:toll/interleukin-1 receptor domain-containing protein (plasmid) [Pantoea agglomerans]|uniref:TIR domain-containing protein n=1 Tax=Enterobacter agglomerans TaxID=549 RepID=UPI00273A61DB|nr:TIR domain-containing protein [Pantoea agglomerans]WLO87065.1 toll/interleukin-1 receptor domain-containing protein [Pantoea agglomerans]